MSVHFIVTVQSAKTRTFLNVLGGLIISQIEKEDMSSKRKTYGNPGLVQLCCSAKNDCVWFRNSSQNVSVPMWIRPTMISDRTVRVCVSQKSMRRIYVSRKSCFWLKSTLFIKKRFFMIH